MKKRPPRSSRRLTIEMLEARRTMTASASFNSGVLTVNGGTGNDTIYLKNISNRIYVADGSLGNNVRIAVGSASWASIGIGAITAIKVYAGSGNDTIRGDSGNFSGQSTIPVKMHLYGQANNDVLWSGSGSDELYGGSGNDELHGNSNDDQLFGGTGNDELYGGSGTDALYGGANNDKLFGQGDVDYLYGDSGNDRLNGGEGRDFIYGGDGTDIFHRTIGTNGFSLGGQPSPDSDESISEPQQVAGAFLSDSTPPTSDSYTHIDQNDSPTCSFFASLAAVARFTTTTATSAAQEDLVKRISYDAAEGMYTVRLYVNGAWKDYRLNGYWSESGMGSGPFWTSLYLKAYLMANDVDYYDANGFATDPDSWASSTGANWKSSAVAIRMLTGYSTGFFSLSGADPQDFRNKLLAGRIYVASSLDSAPDYFVVDDHAYTVLNVFQAGSNWYVDLYNPWRTTAVNASGYGTITSLGRVRLTWAQYLRNFEGQTRNTN